MTYADLLLKGGLGWGNSGIVVQGVLTKDKGRKAIERVARLEIAQGEGCEQWTVAVKCVKGESIYMREREVYLIIIRHSCTLPVVQYLHKHTEKQ